MLRPAMAVKVPGAQSMASSEPVGQKVPAGHVMQSSLLVMTSNEGLICVPAGQGSGAEAPTGQ